MTERTNEAAEFIRALVSAWDCCGTCAGGVLVRRERQIKAEAWDEGMRMGTSRAMRMMSDEPDLSLASADDNPYRSPAHPNPEPPTGDGGREGVGRRA